MVSTTLKINKTTKTRIDEIDFTNLPFGKNFSDHMFVADYQDGKWTNMRIDPFGNFSVHPANIAWHYGQAIFEGMKATKNINGQPVLFRPEMHSVRINKSAERMAMPAFPKEAFMEAVYQLVKLDQDWIPKEEGSALYLRPFMIAMDEYIGVQIAQNYKFVIFTCPVGPYYSKDLKLKAEDTFIRAAGGGTGEAKAAGNYAGSLMPTKKAKEEGYDQIMWLDANQFHYVQEVGTMNIFFVMDDIIVTPNTDGSILKGITRDSALQIFKSKGYTVEQRPISINEIMIAGKQGRLTEVFGTGTAAVVANVKTIGYKGESITLDTSKYKMSPMLMDTINGIRSGRLEDEFGWTVPVE